MLTPDVDQWIAEAEARCEAARIVGKRWEWFDTLNCGQDSLSEVGGGQEITRRNADAVILLSCSECAGDERVSPDDDSLRQPRKDLLASLPADLPRALRLLRKYREALEMVADKGCDHMHEGCTCAWELKEVADWVLACTGEDP